MVEYKIQHLMKQFQDFTLKQLNRFHSTSQVDVATETGSMEIKGEFRGIPQTFRPSTTEDRGMRTGMCSLNIIIAD